MLGVQEVYKCMGSMRSKTCLEQLMDYRMNKEPFSDIISWQILQTAIDSGDIFAVELLWGYFRSEMNSKSGLFSSNQAYCLAARSFNAEI